FYFAINNYLTSKGIGKACGNIFHIAEMTVSPISKTTSSVCSEADEIFCIFLGFRYGLLSTHLVIVNLLS
ncbi:hypothetical protein, partial [Parageobacillus thermoglucosidasius]|uniref:hypothetical protein n=1 Tax=Parageobacillus thermoglucosidasius TaxID=1426 RepID=UPI003D2CBBDB